MRNRSVGNAVVLALLSSPFHRLVSGALAIVEYQGRRSDRQVHLPVQYAVLDGDVIVCPANPESKLWWRNFEHPHPATITIAGRRFESVGAVVTDPETTDRAAIAYRHRFPKIRTLESIVVFTRSSP